MLNVRLAGSHLYGKQLFTWVSLVMSLTGSFSVCCPFALRDVLNENWDLIGSVSEGFPSYFSSSFPNRWQLSYLY